MAGNSLVSVEVSPGELIDKITILEIKQERIADPQKLANVGKELELLTTTRDQTLESSETLERLTCELKAVNEQLWDIEDEIRDCERNQDFGERFIALARSVYRSNDRRAALKYDINRALNSQLFEEKSYAGY